MNKWKNMASLVGRVLLAFLFIAAGTEKVGGFDDTAGFIASKGLPLPQVGVAIAILAEVGGGMLLAIGWKARWAALALAVFTLVTSIFFHDFWTMAGEARTTNLVMFLKNIAVVGGLLMVCAFGPGRYSVDRT